MLLNQRLKLLQQDDPADTDPAQGLFVTHSVFLSFIYLIFHPKIIKSQV